MKKREIAVRNKDELLPNFSAFVDEIDKNGVNEQLLYKIINKHRCNRLYNKGLWERYEAVKGGVPIFDREARFDENKPINNKVNNDFFGEIVDFKTGYFAGAPISYSYDGTDESEIVTGGEEAVKIAKKTISDFITRNNMYGVDMETTRRASVYGYCGRLFYISIEGDVRVIPVHGYETIILTKTNIAEPRYAVRYYEITDINDKDSWVVEFYNDDYVHTYTGMLSQLKFVGKELHGFASCPLQGIANNDECMGDAEKVLTLIDAYDKAVSDNSNEMESSAHAYMIIEGLRIDDDTIERGQKSGTYVLPSVGTQNGKMYFLTKNINDTFTEHNLQRMEDNIYRFSKTPNLKDSAFGTSSGVALKFKLHGLETKCGSFQAQFMNSMQYMWKLLSDVWSVKGINVDPLQCTAEFTRNFPQDDLSNAQTAQALIAAGLPKQVAWNIALPQIDDIDYVMDLLEQEQAEIKSLYPDNSNSQDRLYQYQVNMLTDYAEKIRKGEISEKNALKILKAAISLPEDRIRELLRDDDIEETAAEIL